MAVDYTPSPTLKLNCPLIEYFKFIVEPIIEFIVKPIIELAAKSMALLNNYSKIRLFLFLLFYNISSNL